MELIWSDIVALALMDYADGSPDRGRLRCFTNALWIWLVGHVCGQSIVASGKRANSKPSLILSVVRLIRDFADTSAPEDLTNAISMNSGPGGVLNPMCILIRGRGSSASLRLIQTANAVLEGIEVQRFRVHVRVQTSVRPNFGKLR